MLPNKVHTFKKRKPKRNFVNRDVAQLKSVQLAEILNFWNADLIIDKNRTGQYYNIQV